MERIAQSPHPMRQRLGPGALYSALVGAGARVRVPRPLRRPFYGAFARAVGADVSEARDPLDAYPSLGDFFARRLRDGCREVDTAGDALVSPCDGVVAASGRADDGVLIQAKGRDYQLAALVGDDELAAQLRGGTYSTIYLSPKDYHRVHAPLGGRVARYDYLPGTFWPVNPRFVRRVDGLFARNERVVITLDVPNVGPVAVVMVGAAGVGNLWLAHAAGARVPDGQTRHWRGHGAKRLAVAPHTSIDAGDELGAFLLGSTVVLVFPPGAVALDVGEGAKVRCGERIGRVTA